MNDFDPQAPFIGSDGLEYGCVADKILGLPLSCWRNEEILSRRARGESEEEIRTWIKAYDGDDYVPGKGPDERRQFRAFGFELSTALADP